MHFAHAEHLYQLSRASTDHMRIMDVFFFCFLHFHLSIASVFAYAQAVGAHHEFMFS